MSARIHKAGSGHLQMLKDAEEGFLREGVNQDVSRVVDELLLCFEDESGSTEWSVSAREYYTIKETAKWWNLNKSDY